MWFGRVATDVRPVGGDGARPVFEGMAGWIQVTYASAYDLRSDPDLVGPGAPGIRVTSKAYMTFEVTQTL
jgi:hypothetical protein